MSEANVTAETKFYATLAGPLMGVYYPLPFDNERDNRVALNTSKLAKLWCSIYPKDEVDKQVRKYGGCVLPAEFALKLDYDSFAVARVGG